MMARSPRFVRPCGWLVFVPLVSLVLFAGCRSDSSSRNSSNGGGCCGGGCCRGTTPNDTPSLLSRSGSATADPLTAPQANRADSAAANQPASSSLLAQSPYGGQKTCPVTGEPLGGMGPAIPVSIKGQTIYVCCRGCVAKVQRDPDTFLRKVEAERGQRSPSGF